MPLMDSIKNGLTKIIPAGKSSHSPAGIGNGGHGMVPFDDDMIVPKITIVAHAGQIFFNFLAMCCFASVASFQAKWKVGPSGLSGLTIFLTVAGMLLSAFLLAVPVIYEKHDKFTTLARTLKELRVSFILTGAGTAFSLLIAFVVIISAFTQAGCKDPKKDPHADLGDDFLNNLPGWCSTKKAGAVFLWLAFLFWAISLGYLVYQWRQGKLNGPRDPPFIRPDTDHNYDDDEESSYHVIPAPARRETTEHDSPFDDSNRYSSGNTGYTGAASRPSMDAYGAFSDPAPTGFGATPSRTAFNAPPTIPEPDFGPKVSRTMQYADPYAAVRASIAGPPQGATPPSYDQYQGYR